MSMTFGSIFNKISDYVSSNPQNLFYRTLSKRHSWIIDGFCMYFFLVILSLFKLHRTAEMGYFRKVYLVYYRWLMYGMMRNSPTRTWLVDILKCCNNCINVHVEW